MNTGKVTVLAFISAKGGSGKTVLSTSLAVLLGAMGRRVLIVDCDAATNGLTLLNLTRLLGERVDREGSGLFEDDAKGRDILRVPIAENVDLLPATSRMRQTEDTPPEFVRARLSSVLAQAPLEYDFVILDAQAGADTYAELAVNFADKVIIVSEYDPVSAEGVERLKRLFRETLDTAEVWTLFNKVLPEFASLRSDFLEVVRLLPPVAWDADVIRAFTRRKLAIDTDKGNAYTFALLAVLESLLQDEIQDDLSVWLAGKDKLLRDPVQERVSKLSRRVAVVEGQLAEAEFSVRQGHPRIWRPLLEAPIGALAAVTVLAAVTARNSLPAPYSPRVFYILPVAVAAVALTIMVLINWRRMRSAAEPELQGLIYGLRRERERLTVELAKYQQLLEADVVTLSQTRMPLHQGEPAEL